MIREVSVTVVFPETFTMLVDDSRAIDDIINDIKDYASQLLQGGPCEPIIQDCVNFPELVE